MTTPDPWAVDGVVALDLAERTATVIPADPGYPAMLWRNGVEKMTRGPYGSADVWAHVPGRRQVAPAVPEGGALRFRFPQGDPAWAELVGTARLAATVVLDRAGQKIMSVELRGRRG